MSFARTYATKDTWITDAAASANFGLSPILEVWSNYNNLIKESIQIQEQIILYLLLFV